MSLTLATAGLIGAGIGAGANLIGNTATNILNVREAKKTRKFNAEQAELNRQFQREMRDTALISSVNQARELGISPSLVLGQGSSALGGSQASASGGQASVTNTGIASATNGILNAINEQNRLNTMQEMNEDRLQTMKELQELRTNNSVSSNKAQEYMKRNGYNSREELNKAFFTDLNNVKI